MHKHYFRSWKTWEPCPLKWTCLKHSEIIWNYHSLPRAKCTFFSLESAEASFIIPFCSLLHLKSFFEPWCRGCGRSSASDCVDPGQAWKADADLRCSVFTWLLSRRSALDLIFETTFLIFKLQQLQYLVLLHASYVSLLHPLSRRLSHFLARTGQSCTRIGQYFRLYKAIAKFTFRLLAFFCIQQVAIETNSGVSGRQKAWWPQSLKCVVASASSESWLILLISKYDLSVVITFYITCYIILYHFILFSTSISIFWIRCISRCFCNMGGQPEIVARSIQAGCFDLRGHWQQLDQDKTELMNSHKICIRNYT